MKKCPNCGRTYDSGDRFCDECGTPLVEVEEKKKSALPVLIGCGAVAVLVIAGTITAVMVWKGKDGAEKQTAEVVQIEEEKEEQEEPVKIKEVEEPVTIEEVEEPVTIEEVEKSAKTEEEPKEDTVEMKVLEGDAGEAEEITETEEIEETEERVEKTGEKYETYYVVNCQESITLRKSPSIDAAEICQLPLGAAVSYVETAENGFYKIIYNGKTGYGLASYLDTDSRAASDGKTPETSSGTYLQVINCEESITLRKTPSTKADQFCQIPLGASVEYLGAAENGFYMVSYNGYTGYALARYLG